MSSITNKVRHYIFLCTAMAVFFLLASLLIVRPVLVIGESMEPTLNSGQFLVGISRQVNPFVRLQRADVVLVRSEERGAVLIKRLIGFPGDTVEIRNNRVLVNGKDICEWYLGEPMVTPDVKPFFLDEGMYYVLGDNRNISADSRYFGPFSESDIIAVVPLEYQFFLVPIMLFFLACSVFFLDRALDPPPTIKPEALTAKTA